MKTNEELRQWAENIARGGWGKVTVKIVDGVIRDCANAQESQQGFTRQDIRTITEYVNEIQGC